MNRGDYCTNEVHSIEISKDSEWVNLSKLGDGFFYFWYWILFLVICSPVIIGIAVLGWHRRVLLRPREFGLIKNAYLG